MKRTFKDWLIVLAALADEALVVLIVLLLFWWLKVPFTWPVILVLVLLCAGSAFIIYKLVIPAYRRKTTTGREGLIGMEGWVIEPLQPQGLIKVKDELWQAKSLEGTLAAGEKVRITAIRGLVLDVVRLEHRP